MPINSPSIQPPPANRRGGARMHEPSPVPAPVVAVFAAIRRILGKPESRRDVTHRPDGVEHTGQWTLHVSVEPDPLDGGYVAEALDFPGALAQGETEEAALENLIDALQGVIAVRMEERIRSLDAEPDAPASSGRVVEFSF